jgi:hypothetical protein
MCVWIKKEPISIQLALFPGLCHFWLHENCLCTGPGICNYECGWVAILKRQVKVALLLEACLHSLSMPQIYYWKSLEKVEKHRLFMWIMTYNYVDHVSLDSRPCNGFRSRTRKSRRPGNEASKQHYTSKSFRLCAGVDWVASSWSWQLSKFLLLFFNIIFPVFLFLHIFLIRDLLVLPIHTYYTYRACTTCRYGSRTGWIR